MKLSDLKTVKEDLGKPTVVQVEKGLTTKEAMKQAPIEEIVWRL